MKTRMKISLLTCALLSILSVQSQKTSSQGVNLVLDMQPVLEVEFVSPPQINFVFDEKGKFYKGIIHRGATEIKVTSTVSWDMYAVGRSTSKNPNGVKYWDQKVSYGSNDNTVANLPLSLVEIKQSNKNVGVHHKKAKHQDYSTHFSGGIIPNASNSLYVSSNGTPSPPTKNGKYLAGHSGDTSFSENGYMPAGSYYSNYSNKSNFHFLIDYRILPGFPAIFPNAFNEDATIAENLVSDRSNNAIYAGRPDSNPKKIIAEPGYYTMNVQYVIMEDQ